MTRSPVQPGAWNDWDATTWGLALLRHYFVGHEVAPVSRLAISPEELALAAGAPQTEAAPVRDAFLKSVRCSPTEFRRRVSIASLAGWNHRDPPSFLAYLFFTCFAAALLDSDTADEGVFRERVRHLLRHDEGTTYRFDHLSLLWEAFASWLRERHNAGEPYRTLSLPERGGMTRIGYSIRLAFPRRQDRLRLLEALASSGVGASPTVVEAFQAIGGARNRFSGVFLNVFDQARAALASARNIPELQALWSAILEVAPLAARAREHRQRARYQVIAQENELGRLEPFVVTTTPLSAARGIQFSALDEPFADFGYFLSSNERTDLIAKLLLMQALTDAVPGFSSSAIPRAVREGVLLFREAGSAIWELAVTRPTEGRVRALVRTTMIESFMRLVPTAQRRSRDTEYDGWRETVAFDAAELVEPRKSTAPDLIAVRCLQRVEIGPQLHLLDGVRVDDGYLGLSGLRPDVHCSEATQVRLIRRSGEGEDARIADVGTLSAVAERPGVFGWTLDEGDLDGAFLLMGAQQESVIARRAVTFHSRVLSLDYESPSDESRWFIEGCTSDVSPAGKAASDFLISEMGRPTLRPSIEAFDAGDGRLLPLHSVDDTAAHDRFVEALAAIAATRKGITEAELVELLRKITGCAGVEVWGMIRGWLEAGYLDCLGKRQWRGRVYFARRPRLVLVPEASAQSVRCILHGLAPFRLRQAAREAFSRALATPLPSASLSQVVPAPQAWRCESLEHVSAAVGALGELDTVGIREPSELANDFDSVVSDELPLPPGYELQGVWDWESRRFRANKKTLEADEVRIEYHTRSNGPDRYVVDVKGKRRTTLSRSWALLDGFRRAGRPAFSPVGSVALTRSGEDGPQVPLPLARTIGLRSGIVGGPATSAILGRHYTLAAESPSVRRWLLAWLSGVKSDETLVRRFAWLRSVTSARPRESFLLPTDIRQRLRKLEFLPDALWIADQRIPRHLIVHVRRAIELAEA